MQEAPVQTMDAQEVLSTAHTHMHTNMSLKAFTGSTGRSGCAGDGTVGRFTRVHGMHTHMHTLN